jgi:hypothetical protein
LRIARWEAQLLVLSESTSAVEDPMRGSAAGST